MGPDTEVETHIEPLIVPSLSGTDAGPETTEAVAASLRRGAAETGTITDVHSVRVRTTEHGLVVNYHCRVNPLLDVASVHECVDRLEHAARNDYPEITRIVSHTEPVRPSAP